MRVHDIPRELIHILARFAPFAAIFLVRTDRQFWERFWNDPEIWVGAAKMAQRTRSGRQALQGASLLLSRCPSLKRFIPTRVIDGAGFEISRDHFVVSARSSVQIVLRDSLRVIATFDKDTHRVLTWNQTTPIVALSPSQALIAVGIGIMLVVSSLYSCSLTHH